MRTALALCALIGLSSCAQLDDVEDGTCGNFVLEPGEDCDGTAAEGTCGAPGDENECALLCDEDGVGCPAGWGCGVDGRCRRPSGEFAEAPGSPYLFPVSDFALGDVDGDGFADLAGIDDSAIRLRFGDEAAQFSDERIERVATPSGEATFAQFSADDRLDVMFPTAEGVVALLGTAERGLAPVLYPQIVVEETNKIRYDAVDAALNGAIELVLTIEIVAGQPVVLFPEGDNGIDLSSAAVFGEPIAFADVYHPMPATNLNALEDILLEGTLREEFVVVARGQDKVAVLSTTGFPEDEGGDGLEPIIRQIVDLPDDTVAFGRAFFANFDDDASMDLFVPVAVDGIGNGPCDDYLSIAVMKSNATGVLGTAFLPPFFVPPGCQGAPEVSVSQIPLLITDLSNDGRADYVFPTGLYIGNFGTLAGGDTSVIASTASPNAPSDGTNLWSSAVKGDFNGDSLIDFAATTSRASGGPPTPEPGIDIYLNANLFGVVNGHHIETATPVKLDTDGVAEFPDRDSASLIAAGDFDGDLISDVLVIVRAPGQSDEVLVVFGSPGGGFDTPVSMGFADNVEQATAFVGFNVFGQADLIFDLVLLRPAPSGTTALVSVMQGSSARRLLSPLGLFDLIEDTALVANRVLPGQFDGAGPRDIVVVSRAIPTGIGSIVDEGTPIAVFVPGTGPVGELDLSNANVINLVTESWAPLCTEWAVGDLGVDGGDGRDELVGLDQRCDGLAGASSVIVGTVENATTLSLAATPLADESLHPERVELQDMDSDGGIDLAIHFSDGADAASVGIYWNDGAGGFSGSLDLPPIQLAAGTRSTAPISLNADTDVDFIAIGDGGAETFVFEGAGFSSAGVVMAEAVREGRGQGVVRVGDVNGDGIEDFAFADPPSVRVFLGVPAPSLGDEEQGTGAEPDVVPDDSGGS